ncbi:hypothetical protein PTSG_03132 [Salpingoeca rosetta]|uniref:Uncharacterized protein n=1 Tax=Salpingoeca rosetta (strain ATCC 50818 / BSB-021) TaxID=946362 RepID=F2U4B7_SALR5|nr:uncharacterized protein PTSG_03132 [Salpingoeca rosetta]EGD82483.1 hypothetical protein PTSG_03132 [Salpingoeca rosetta]|eukprot:XP_004995719.1 hypothetical protein PTSG_03132 [Salpingoeca rosetta]
MPSRASTLEYMFWISPHLTGVRGCCASSGESGCWSHPVVGVASPGPLRVLWRQHQRHLHQKAPVLVLVLPHAEFRPSSWVRASVRLGMICVGVVLVLLPVVAVMRVPWGLLDLELGARRARPDEHRAGDLGFVCDLGDVALCVAADRGPSSGCGAGSVQLTLFVLVKLACVSDDEASFSASSNV